MVKAKGRCYCGSVQFEFEGEGTSIECYCRECQYISGGSQNTAHIVKKVYFGGCKERQNRLPEPTWKPPERDCSVRTVVPPWPP